MSNSQLKEADDELLFSQIQSVVEGTQDEQMLLAISSMHELQSRHYKPIVAFVKRMSLDKENADDVAQETWIKVWEKRHSFRGESKFKSWLYQIAENEGKDANKKQKKILSRVTSYDGKDEDEQDSFIERQADSRPQPDQLLNESATQNRLRPVLNMVINELEEPYKRIFLLHANEKWTFKKIAQHLYAEKLTTKLLEANNIECRYKTAVRRLKSALKAKGFISSDLLDLN